MTTEQTKQHIRWYRFAWNNREIPKGAVVRLISVGKLNSVLVERLLDGKRYITDRRALRKDYDEKIGEAEA